ncbi:Uncharacterised protein [Mycobacterium tuberculosis]|uniref:Uncharacterized protein n=1 Tax=Mycobacterium tuberculosis TaxID=1773 RepID=A0A916LA37_MYCTX|nr:Uncharacterised protein [Mycobacterium tuberculosis]COX69537.1 Uncharacterised protein [Mycobacterium tuberculosis]COX94907.1 Uncharacterised protein [Mycobacterium tuberculosis]COY47879.1 Uncharacterised protein [Mycobacterium tuberculosis]
MRSGGWAGMRNIPISIVNPSWLYRSDARRAAVAPFAYITVLPRYFVVHKCFFAWEFVYIDHSHVRIGYGHVG